MTETTPVDLDPIRERLEAATAGPWEAEASHPTMSGQRWDIRRKGVPGIRLHVTEYCRGGWDVDLIAHAPTDIANLLAEVERLRELAYNVDRQLMNAFNDAIPESMHWVDRRSARSALFDAFAARRKGDR